MFVEIDIILHPAGPSRCRAPPTLGNNLAAATKTPKNPQQDKNSASTCAFYPSCSHTSTARPCSLQNRQRGPGSVWSVVWVQPSPVSGAASWLFSPPFFSSIFLYPVLTPPFRFFPCLSSHAASVLGGRQQLSTARLSVHPRWLLDLSTFRQPLPPSQVPLWGRFSLFFCFVGLPKGAQRESKLPAAHACQMFGERSLQKERRGRRRGGGG